MITEVDGMQDDVQVEGHGGTEGSVEPKPNPNPLEPGGVRFEQIYGKMKEYETQLKRWGEFGDPDEIKRIRDEHAQWKQALEAYREQQKMTPDQKSEAQRAEALRQELKKVWPELEAVSTVKELMKQVEELRNGLREQSVQAIVQKASEAFSEVLKANKIDLKHQDKIEEYIIAQMSDEDKKAFINGDFSIAEKIFNSEMKDGLFASLKAKPSLPAPSVRHTPGGTPPAGKPTGPKTWKDAEEAGWARIKASRE